jgi:hypothetical protein
VTAHADRYDAHTEAAEAFERAHRDCEADWECVGCGRPVCPRCEVSPGEAVGLCPECWWTEDPEGSAA